MPTRFFFFFFEGKIEMSFMAWSPTIEVFSWRQTKYKIFGLPPNILFF
jgi:hypothetical protein